jgi:hypothetical protein
MAEQLQVRCTSRFRSLGVACSCSRMCSCRCSVSSVCLCPPVRLSACVCVVLPVLDASCALGLASLRNRTGRADGMRPLLPLPCLAAGLCGPSAHLRRDRSCRCDGTVQPRHWTKLAACIAHARAARRHGQILAVCTGTHAHKNRAGGWNHLARTTTNANARVRPRTRTARTRTHTHTHTHTHTTCTHLRTHTRIHAHACTHA